MSVTVSAKRVSKSVHTERMTLKTTSHTTSLLLCADGSCRISMVDKSQQRQNISNSSRVHLRFAGPTPVDLIHDFLCPAKGVRDRSNGCRHALPAVVLRELPCRENRRGELLCAGAFLVSSAHS